MVEYSIRPATSDEARVIRDLVHQARINPTGLAWQRFLIAVTSEGRVIGCGQIKPHGEGIRELASIVVDPEFRGNGVAGRIISQLLSSSPMPIYLMCRSTLGTFYSRFGFSPVPVDEMPVYFRRIARLTGLFSHLNKEAGTLLIMKHE